MTKQAKNNNLNYLLDPVLSKVNRLFVLPFKFNEDENKDDRISFYKNYTLSAEIKDFMFSLMPKDFLMFL